MRGREEKEKIELCTYALQLASLWYNIMFIMYMYIPIRDLVDVMCATVLVTVALVT